jgi:hypothetical protein
MADEQVPSIDMQAINAEIAKLPQSELIEQLTKVRVRQKVQQKKQQGKGSQKAYQLKQRAKFNAMKEAALATKATVPGFANLWEQINAQAETAAESQVEVDTVGADTETA